MDTPRTSISTRLLQGSYQTSLIAVVELKPVLNQLEVKKSKNHNAQLFLADSADFKDALLWLVLCFACNASFWSAPWFLGSPAPSMAPAPPLMADAPGMALTTLAKTPASVMVLFFEKVLRPSYRLMPDNRRLSRCLEFCLFFALFEAAPCPLRRLIPDHGRICHCSAVGGCRASSRVVKFLGAELFLGADPQALTTRDRKRRVLIRRGRWTLGEISKDASCVLRVAGRIRRSRVGGVEGDAS